MHSYYTGVDAMMKARMFRQNKWHGAALERSRVVQWRWHLGESMAVPQSGNMKINSRQPPTHLSQAFQKDGAACTPWYAGGSVSVGENTTKGRTSDIGPQCNGQQTVQENKEVWVGQLVGVGGLNTS